MFFYENMTFTGLYLWNTWALTRKYKNEKC